MYSKTNILLIFFLFGCNSSSLTEPSLSDSTLFINISQSNEPNSIVAGIQILAKGANSESNRYIEYNIKHILDQSTNTDLWRLYELYESENISNTDDLYSFSRVYNGKPIANAGGWESAIREVGASDFIGEYHGDETLKSVLLFVDGSPVSIIDSQFIGDSFSFEQISELYSWHSGEIVALRKKQYNFSQSGFTLNQRIEWLASLDLNHAYMTMFPIKRKIDGELGDQITDTASFHPSGYIQDIANSGFDVNVSSDDNEVWITGEDSNFRAEIKMTSYPVLSNYKLFISNTEAYNKVYFDISGTGSNSYTTVIGEIWETSSTYTITTFN